MRKTKKVISILLLAALLVLQVSVLVVHADTQTSPVTFTLTSELPKRDGGSIILIYEGEATDFFVELKPENEYVFETSLPLGMYTLKEAISTIEKEYSYDLAGTIAIVEGDNNIEVKVKDEDLTDELRKARAEDLTSRNKVAEEEIGLKVNEVNATADVKKESSKLPIVVVSTIIGLFAVILTAVTTVRANRKKNED